MSHDVPADDATVNVEHLLRAVINFANAEGSSAGVRLLTDELESVASDVATVLVGGETKQGKSSLVNSLIGRQRLLPVDVDVATSVYLKVRHAANDFALAYTKDASDGVPIELSELADYASVAGDPEKTRDVYAVEVGIDSGLLERGLALVDTPGVSGLESGHADITLAALRWADALIFVTDASAPLSRPEIAFLKQATTRIATVILVLTKKDLFAGWHQIEVANRQLLEQTMPHFALTPTVAVSSWLWHEAAVLRAGGRDDLAVQIEEESGFTELIDLLDNRITSRVAQLRSETAVRLASSVLLSIQSDLATVLRSLDGDPAFEESLTAERQRYADLGSFTSTWRRDLHISIERLRVDLMQLELPRQFQRAHNTWDARLASGDPGLRDPAELVSQLELSIGAIWMELNSNLRARATDVVATLLEQDDIELDLIELPLPSRVSSFERTPAPTTDGGIAGAVVRNMPFAGAALTANAVLGMLLGPLGPMLGILGGIGIGAVTKRTRGVQEERARFERDARQFIKRTLDDSRLEVTAELQKLISDVRAGIEDLIGAHLVKRQNDLEELLADHERRLAQSQEEQRRTRTKAEASLDELRSLQDRASLLLVSVEYRNVDDGPE